MAFLSILGKNDKNKTKIHVKARCCFCCCCAQGTREVFNSINRQNDDAYKCLVKQHFLFIEKPWKRTQAAQLFWLSARGHLYTKTRVQSHNFLIVTGNAQIILFVYPYASFGPFIGFTACRLATKNLLYSVCLC